MKQKLVAALLAVAMVATLAACGGKSAETEAPAADTPAAETEAETPEADAPTADAEAGETKELSELKLAFIVGTENDAFYQSEIGRAHV